MRKLLVALTIAAGLAIGAPAVASADPADHVPYCSGDQTPMDTACRPAPSQVFTHEGSGLSPELPYGTNPGNEPAI
ncbi:MULTISPECIES: hypothetical protein [unclassified Mycobacterium]|uniref:hypothetical protein n=1 Tax=unclassified Mycobacterium TaxID=2642494 RepID=UPI0029C8ACFE|nr:MULTISPECIES: hypothetical protein [unclassified Mycobacterium]